MLPFDAAAARCFGELKADLDRNGTSLAEPDLRIAAIVLTAEVTLVTRNVKHFARVPGLVIENWIDEIQQLVRGSPPAPVRCPPPPAG